MKNEDGTISAEDFKAGNYTIEDLFPTTEKDKIKGLMNLLDEPTEAEFLKEQLMKSLREEETRYKKEELPKVKEKINEFINEQDKEWRVEVRTKQIDIEIKEALKEIDFYSKQKEKLGFVFIKEKELRQANSKYKRLYFEQKRLNGEVNYKDDSFDESMIEQCRDVDIAELNEYDMKKANHNRKFSLCPFHNEKTPSFWVFDDNSWKCFGCGANGQNAIDFVMKKKGLSFRDAVNHLRTY